MTDKQELELLTKRLRKQIVEKQTNTGNFLITVETLLTLLEEYLLED
tara:strand:+ start:647 stop:787 length:141 start_codon:yes stop_codon:yes gene_type:complete